MVAREHFEWDGMFWVAKLEVPEWQCSEHVQLVLFPEASSPDPLGDDAMEIVHSFSLHREAQAASALTSLLAAYPGIYDSYVDAIDPDFVDQDLPPVNSNAELLKLVTLKSIHLQPVVVNGLPYAGYEAECSWDPEHGVGIMMHAERCVALGGADTAVMQWIAERDAKKLEQA